MPLDELKPSQVKQIIHSEFRQLPETHWIQNLRHPSYQLRQPIPIIIVRKGDSVTANYDDIDVCGAGDCVKTAISDVCEKIVEHYEMLREGVNPHDGLPTQDYAFLKQIIEEIPPKAVSSTRWDEAKRFYQEMLSAIPYVNEGYINISAPNYADVILILSEKSVDLIKQLAQIDLDLNLKFRPLCFHIEYELSTENLNLDAFDRFV